MVDFEVLGHVLDVVHLLHPIGLQQMHVSLLHRLLVADGGVVVVLEWERVAAASCLHELILGMVLVLLVLLLMLRVILCHVGVWVVLDSI